MQHWHVDRRVPLALIVTLFLQAGAAIWWAAGKDKQDSFQDARLQIVEQTGRRASDVQGQIGERLARLEERSTAQLDILKRIERRLGGQKESGRKEDMP